MQYRPFRYARPKLGLPKNRLSDQDQKHPRQQDLPDRVDKEKPQELEL
jgi:hypothetical protein